MTSTKLACGLCGGAFGRELRTRRPPRCGACLLFQRLISWELAGPVPVLALFPWTQAIHAASPGDHEGGRLQDVARMENLTALAMVAAAMWRARDGKKVQERPLLASRARARGVADWDVVKVELCREGVAAAIAELGRPGRYRLARKWTEGTPTEDEARRTLRWFFNRAIRVARDALQAGSVGSVSDVEYVEGVHGATLVDDGAAELEADSDRLEAEAAKLRRLLAGVGPRQRQLVEALLEARRLDPTRSVASVARELGTTPGAARQALHRLKVVRRARKSG